MYNRTLTMVFHGFHFLRNPGFAIIPFLFMLSMLSSCIKSPSEPAVQEPSSITLSSSRIVLTSIGQRVLLTATVLDQDSRVIQDATVFFRSGNVKIATVSDNGLVTAVSMGTTQINVSSGYATASATVTVMQEAGRIKITPASATLERVGETVQLKAEVFDTGSTAIPGAVVLWSSSHPTVATVDANGIVAAVSSGTTQITATSGGVSAYRPVYVVLPQPAARIDLNILQATLTSIGQSLKLDALVYDIDGMAIPDAPVSWTSSHPAVATVDSTGLVSAISNGTTLITATSGGVSTFATIHVVIEGTVPPPEPSIDRDVFFAFYHATGGPNWTNNTNWLTEAPLDEWYGVATDSDGRVRTLSLGDNNLIGSLPPALGQLVSLEVLDLNTNQLAGIIPADLGDLVNLTWLQLRDNQLIGRIPAELGQLTNLTGMFFGSNRLTGPIPAELGQLIDLEQLELGRNQLSGGIPSELGQLSNLVRLDLGNNHLSGSIPTELGELTSLAQLDLSLNEITGDIPVELGQLTNLRGLRLGTNQLTGGIPVELGQLTMLDTIDLGSNQLTGPIPSELGQLTSLDVLVIKSNMLSGSLPSELGGLTSLRTLDLHDNMDLSGPLPSELVHVPLESLRLNGTQLCAPLTAAFQAWLAGINDRSVDNCAPTPDPDPDPDPDPVVDRIRINPTSATLIEVGQTKLLTATVYDTDNVEIPGAMVTWTSSDPAVASVDTNGLVTAVARGNATITAALDGKSDSAAISVVLPAARVEVDPSTATLTIVGATKQLTAKVYDTNDDVITDAPVAWTSGDPSVATVNRIGMVTAIGSGAATITATSEGTSDSATISVELTGARIEIELSKDKLTSVGATEQLSAKVYDSNENVIADAPVAWSSSDPSVATVDANGLVTAVSRGNTTITATSGIQSANVVITVDLPADQIDIDPDSETLTSVGATVQLTATVYDENNDVIEDATVAWESDDTSVATVSTSGLVTAVSRGTTTITATSGDKSKTASITVDLPADQIDIDPDSETLTSVGATVQLSATVYDANNDIITGATVTWASGNTNVVTVDSNGLVTAVAVGSTEITATSDGESGSATISVELPAGSIEIDPQSATLTAVADTVQLTATVYDANKDIVSGATVIWASSDPNVATISTSGLVTAVARGSTTITATSGSESDEADITVDLPAKRIDIDPSSVTLSSVGATEQLTATVYDENSDIISGATVAWASSDTSVATVSLSGLVTAVADGSANITASSDTISASIQVTVMTTSPDRDVLVAIYNATDGDNWKDNTGWLSDNPIGKWGGVSTNADGRVTSLSLRRNSLKNSLPPSLGDLSELTSLDLSGNTTLWYVSMDGPVFQKLGGSIPTSVGNLSNLTTLNLSGNGFTSLPSSIGNLSNLKVLYIYANDFTSLPSSMGNLSSLTHLSAFGLDLSGSIPSWVGSLSSMQQLLLDNNGFTGQIPSSLGNLSNLTVLWLDDNSLTGSIPRSLTNLSRLVSLLLSGNNLTGCIPPALHDIRSNDLDGLDLDDCEE